MPAIKNSQITGRTHKVGKGKVTEIQKKIMKAIKAITGPKTAIWINQSYPSNVFYIDIYATDITKYGFGSSTAQILYTNVIRHLKGFKTLEIDNMELSTFIIEE